MGTIENQVHHQQKNETKGTTLPTSEDLRRELREAQRLVRDGRS